MAKILLEDAIDVAIMFRVPLDFRPDTIRRAFFALLQTEGSQGVQRLARQLYGPLLPIMHYNITTNNALLALRDSPPTTPELLNIVLQLTTLSKASPNLLSRVQQCQDAYESLPIAARTALVASGRKTFDLTLKQGIAYEYSSCDAATKKTLHDLMGAPQLIKALTETSGRPEGGFFLLVHQTKGTKPGTVYALVDELLQEWYRPVHQIMSVYRLAAPFETLTEYSFMQAENLSSDGNKPRG
ncbi:hypothetical protein DXG01_008945 [Tephrocybe rancida]|nr:hypothetical protein DXG01_008945 [Tephrocybe rancida]